MYWNATYVLSSFAHRAYSTVYFQPSYHTFFLMFDSQKMSCKRYLHGVSKSLGTIINVKTDVLKTWKAKSQYLQCVWHLESKNTVFYSTCIYNVFVVASTLMPNTLLFTQIWACWLIMCVPLPPIGREFDVGE